VPGVLNGADVVMSRTSDSPLTGVEEASVGGEKVKSSSSPPVTLTIWLPFAAYMRTSTGRVSPGKSGM
jgi:hypothetical protein